MKNQRSRAMIDLAKKQAFWCEQLPNFEAKYWLPSHFEFLIFDKDQGNYVIKEDLDPSFEDEATEIYHRVNTGWAMWKKAINFNDQQAEIDSLKAKLEQSKKVWISVDFMLPDEGEKVLLAIGDEQTVAEKCRVFGFIDSIDREALRTDLITHWMSLPEPPSKEAQGDGDE